MEERTSTEEIDIPPFYLCPISLEMMKDPVTLPTGITYDRESIERWMFIGRHSTCPVTKQPLVPGDASELMIPNHTLRRLIQSWCAANAHHGVERLPTPRPPINRSQIIKIMEEGATSSSLSQLREIITYSEGNRRCAEAAGIADFLVPVILHWRRRWQEASEALHILKATWLSNQGYQNLVSKNEGFVEVIAGIMMNGDDRARTSAVLVLKSLAPAVSPTRMAAFRKEVFVELVRLVHDRVSPNATKAALKVLCEVCRWGMNRIRAARAGAVGVMIELLISRGEETEGRRRVLELAMVVLDEVCRCTEGRAELSAHAAGLAALGDTLLGVSPAATASSVRVLHSLFRFSATALMLSEAAQVGVVAKLCMVVHLAGGLGGKTKERALEILKLHARIWKDFPCVSSYPLQMIHL